MQEVRIEQLTQRLVDLESKGGGTGGGGGVSEEKVAVLITSVELLRGQISDLETQLSAVSARRSGDNGGGVGASEVENRLRHAEQQQLQMFATMEERMAAQTEAVIERCARPRLKHALSELTWCRG